MAPPDPVGDAQADAQVTRPVLKNGSVARIRVASSIPRPGVTHLEHNPAAQVGRGRQGDRPLRSGMAS